MSTWRIVLRVCDAVDPASDWLCPEGFGGPPVTFG
jgi:hypothetical protein